MKNKRYKKDETVLPCFGVEFLAKHKLMMGKAGSQNGSVLRCSFRDCLG